MIESQIKDLKERNKSQTSLNQTFVNQLDLKVRDLTPHQRMDPLIPVKVKLENVSIIDNIRKIK